MGEHIFISYSRADQEYVDRLVAEMRQRGLETWMDREAHYGSRWLRVVEQMVDTCVSLIVVVSPASSDSEWVEREVLRADFLDKEIYPLLLKGNPSFLLSTAQHVDVRDRSLPGEDFFDLVKRHRDAQLEKASETAVEPEPAVRIEPEMEPEPAVHVEPEVEDEPAVHVETAVEPEPVVPIESEVEPEPVVPIESEVEPEPVVSIESEVEPEPVVHVEPEIQAEPLVAIEPAVDAEPVVRIEPGTVVHLEPEVEAEPAVHVEPELHVAAGARSLEQEPKAADGRQPHAQAVSDSTGDRDLPEPEDDESHEVPADVDHMSGIGGVDASGPAAPSSHLATLFRHRVLLLVSSLVVIAVAAVLFADRTDGGRESETAAVSETSASSSVASPSTAPSEEPEAEGAGPVSTGPGTFSGHAGFVRALVPLPDGRIASGDSNGLILIWDPEDLESPLGMYDAHESSIVAMVALSNGLVASASADSRSVLIWDPARPDTTVGAYRGHTGVITAVAGLSGGRVASAGVEGPVRTPWSEVRIWDADDPATTIATTGDFRPATRSLLESAPGRIISGDWTQVWTWEVGGAAGVPVRFVRHAAVMTKLVDGRIASADGLADSVEIWDPSDPEATLATYTGHSPSTSLFSLLALSDGRIASANSAQIRIWDPDDPGPTLVTYKGHTGPVAAMIELPDGRIASASEDGTVQLWDPDET